MKIQVNRQACCGADDQIGPLEAEYRVDEDAQLSDLINEIVRSRFFQFSSTHDCLTGEVDGKRLVEVYASGGPQPNYLVDSGGLVRQLVGQQSFDFYFRHV